MNELPDESMEVIVPPLPVKKGRKLKKTLIVIAIFIAVPIAAFNIWSYSLDRQLQAELDDIAARGEPIYWADLQPEPVPDDQNAALLYKQLADIPLLAGKTEESKRLKDIVKGIVGDGWPRSEYAEDIAEILHQAESGLELCRSARHLPATDWGFDYSQPAIKFDFDRFKYAQFMSSLLCLAALESHDACDDEAALGYLLDVQRLSRAPYSERFLIPYLVGRNCNVWLGSALEKIIPTLEISAGSAGRVQADIILANLTDESAIIQARIQGFIGERSFEFDTSDRMRRGEGDTEELIKLRAKLPKWLFTFNELFLIRYGTSNVRLAELDNWPATKMALPENIELENAGPLRRKIYFLAIILQLTSSDQVHEFHFRLLAERRMAATALAMRMYELDRGERPESLDQLVPDYLPAVPDDPFFDGKRPISYAPYADKSVLYSVWLDGTDDGGKYSAYEDGDGVDRYESPDLVFFLNGDRPIDNQGSDEAKTQPVAAEAD